MDLNFWLLENLFDLFLQKIFLTGLECLFVENFLDQRKDFYLWKNSLFVENFFDQRKKKLWKTSLFVENFLDQVKCFGGKFPWLWKNSSIKKNSLDCGKLTFFTAEKIIGLIILKTNSTVKTIKTYILSLEQKLSPLASFTAGKINIIFSRRLKHKH